MNLDLKVIAKSLSLSALSFFLVVGVLYAASTIGANIVTTGTLSVTDTSTLTGAVTMSSTLGVTGQTTLANATSSLFTNSGISYLSGNVLVNSVASSSPSENVSVIGDAMLVDTGTTTIKLHSSGTGTGGCIEFESPQGAVLRLYASTTGFALITAGGCE